MRLDTTYHFRAAPRTVGLASRPGMLAVVLLQRVALFGLEERTEIVFVHYDPASAHSHHE